MDILIQKSLSTKVFVKALCCTSYAMFYSDWDRIEKGGNPQVSPTFKYKANKGGL